MVPAEIMPHLYDDGAPGAKDATVSSRKKIPVEFSLYLDLVRFLAAVFVVLYHTWEVFFPSSVVRWPGHEAVVVFFVLSGYVISHAVAQPGMTLAKYFQHRVARIVPVAIVALLCALGIANFLVSRGNGHDFVWPTLLNALFIAQAGWLAVEAPLNPPFWSLNYEVWYYVIFGAWIFSAPRWRKWLTSAALICAGPKILLLFPVWLMGAYLYRQMPTMSRPVACLIFFGTVLLGFVLWWFDVSSVIRNWLYTVFPPVWRAHYSTQFIYDNLLGVVVSANFAAVVALGSSFDWLVKAARPIRYLASFTFSLYVFHSPVLEFLTHYAHVDSPLPFYGSMFLIIFLLAQLTERRVDFFRRMIGGGH